jgi:hypothetical protein
MGRMPYYCLFLDSEFVFFFHYNMFRFKGKKVDVIIIFKGDAKGNDEPS